MLQGKSIFRRQRIEGGCAWHPAPSIMFAENGRLTVGSEKGFVETRLRALEGSDVVIGDVRSTGHVIELREADRLTILLPRAGRLRVRIGGADYGVAPGSPMAFRPGERTTEAIAGRAGHFGATTLHFPMARVRALADAAALPVPGGPGPDAVPFCGRLNAFSLMAMNRLANDIFLLPDVPLPPKVAAAVADVMDEHLLALMHRAGAPPHPRILSAFHRVRAAEDIMHAQGDEPLSMLDLAQKLEMSLRSLQLAFRAVHDGKSPRQVYSRIRLERARQKLLAATSGDQVTSIALDSGFLHLSRFAMSYARAYGELPSETLARRRGRAAGTAAAVET